MKKIVVILLVFWGSSVYAKPENNFIRAEQLYERGKLLFKIGEYQQAIINYNKAFSCFHDEKYILAMAKTFDAIHNFEKAIFYYEQYLKFGIFADNSKKIKQRIEEIKQKTNFGKELISFKVIPTDASIYFEEVSPYSKLKNPYEGFLPWGKHKIIVKREDYEDKVITIDIKKGVKISKLITLEKIQHILRITVQSNPSDSKLYIDDKYMGKTPVEIKINAGYYNVRFEHDDLKIEKIVEFYPSMGSSLTFNLREKKKKVNAIAKKIFIKSKNNQGSVMTVTRKAKFLKPVGWAALGCGIAVLATGGVFSYFAIREAKKAEALDFWELQKQNRYDTEFKKKTDFAQKNLNLATYLYIGGGVLFGAGVTMLIIDSVLEKKKHSIGKVHILPSLKGIVFNYRF